MPGSQLLTPPMVEVPPSMDSFSIRITDEPKCAAAQAAPNPALPPPMTATSQVSAVFCSAVHAHAAHNSVGKIRVYFLGIMTPVSFIWWGESEQGQQFKTTNPEFSRFGLKTDFAFVRCDGMRLVY